MKRIAIVFLTCCAMIACKKIDVDFSYSPTAPKAGEKVTFSNLSTGGEDWAWAFGDGGTSSLKIPSYVYKKPGTYTVTLTVDGKTSQSRIKEITVYDSVPTFVCSDSVFYIYQDYTFTANIYNPYDYDIRYEWNFPLNTIYTAPADSTQKVTNASYKMYFTKALDEAPIWLQIVVNGDTTLIKQQFKVQNRHTNSIVMRNTDGDYRQRVFGSRNELSPTPDNSAKALLDAEQDTLQMYNGKTFRLSELKSTFPEIKGFKIANRKLYFRDNNGLWVSMLDGSYKVQIDNSMCAAMTIDLTDNRIYWSTDDEVRYMPFVGSDNNRFTTKPQTLNRLAGVTKISTDK